MIRSPIPSSLRNLSTFSALHHRDFRLYWMGLVASVSGYMMVVSFSLNWLIFHITEKPIYLGYVGLTLAIPSIVLNLFGGVFADRLNLKRLIGICQSFTAGVVITLAVLTAKGWVEPWHILVASFLIGSVQAFDSPARQSILSRLVPREEMPSAVAMHNFAWQGMGIIAPSLAGILVANFGITTALTVGACGFLTLATLSQVLNISALERQRRNVLREIGDGFNFVKTHALFATLIGMAFFNGFFGMSIVFFMMPVFAEEELNVGPGGMGFLLATFGSGAVIGTFIVGGLRNSYRQQQLIILGMTLFGAFLLLFALSSWFPLSLVLLFFAGMGNSLAMVSINGSLQILVPDDFRGRIMGFYSITFSMPALGAIPMSAIAEAVDVRISAAMGGSLIVAFVWMLKLGSPYFRNLGSEVRAVSLRPSSR